MFRDKLKNILNKDGVNDTGSKKNIENLVFFVIILIITIIIINMVLTDKKTSNKDENNTSSKKLATQSNINSTEDIQKTDNLEGNLEMILSKIQGVGNVNVFVNYSESSEIVAMYNQTSKTNNTEETDTSGGIRKIQETDTQKDIIYKEENGEKVPITQKVIQPKVEGAIITAQGANNATVKTNIIQAVEAVTGLATHKIQVFEMN